MKKLGALWLKTKNDKSFFTGKFGEQNIVIFKNDYKQGNQPDYIIYEGTSSDRKQEDRQPDDDPLEGREDIPF